MNVLADIEDHFRDSTKRLSRGAYWFLFLSVYAGFLLSSALFQSANMETPWHWVVRAVIYFVIWFHLSFALTSLRLHDTGRSNWWLLLLLVPGGALVLLALLFQKSQPHANRYGPVSGSVQRVLNREAARIPVAPVYRAAFQAARDTAQVNELKLLTKLRNSRIIDDSEFSVLKGRIIGRSAA